MLSHYKKFKDKKFGISCINLRVDLYLLSTYTTNSSIYKQSYLFVAILLLTSVIHIRCSQIDHKLILLAVSRIDSTLITRESFNAFTTNCFLISVFSKSNLETRMMATPNMRPKKMSMMMVQPPKIRTQRLRTRKMLNSIDPVHQVSNQKQIRVENQFQLS